VAYVERQKEHHAQGAVIPILERTAEGGVSLVREAVPDYITGHDTGHDDWWQAMLAIR
jgi:hypothetical protein